MITRRQTLAGLSSLAALARPAAAQDMRAAIDAILADKAQSGHVPGYAFLAVRDGKIIHAVAVGQRDREKGLPVTLDTLFPIGSCTKAFTAMAVGVACDRGGMSLDDRPHRYLPYFRMFDADADARITLRDMLSHRTGLLAKADLAAEPGVLTREEYVRAATSARPAFPFRSTFQYSNSMVAGVGEVLGHAGGASWEEVVTRDVLRPAGMTTAQATLLGLDDTPDHVTGYVHDADKGFISTPPPASLVALAPAGAIAASANDMANWLKVLTGGGAPLVRPETLAAITAPQVAVSDKLAYALAWVTYGWNGLKVAEHNGGSEGICALTSFIPEARTGFVFLGNTSPNFLTQIGNLGPLVYPLLLGVSHVRDVPVPSARPDEIVVTDKGYQADPPPAPQIDVGTLLARMTAAMGKPPKAALVAHGDKTYENQGVTAGFSLSARAPAAHEEIELWRAADRDIGRFRLWFDGQAGGQETTFGQDQVYDAATCAGMARDLDVWPWPRLDALYTGMDIGDTAWLSGHRPAVIVNLVARGGGKTDLYISLNDYRVLRKESGGVSTTYGDYREVDGAWLPFSWEIHDGLGLTTVTWRDIAFADSLPDSTFMSAGTV